MKFIKVKTYTLPPPDPVGDIDFGPVDLFEVEVELLFHFLFINLSYFILTALVVVVIVI